jgi:hypothetical protein
MSDEPIAQHMVAGRLGQPYVSRGLFDSSLSHRFMQMMSACARRTASPGWFVRPETPTANLIAVAEWILPLQRVRYINPAEASHQIVLVPLTNIF